MDVATIVYAIVTTMPRLIKEIMTSYCRVFGPCKG